jgi:hypothetical protein
MCATCPAYLILDLTAIIIFGEEHNLKSSSIYNFSQLPVTSSLLALNVFLDTMFPQSRFLPYGERQFHTHIKQQAKL